MITYYEQPIPIIVNQYGRHLDIKQPVLDGIASMGIHNLIETNEQISNTDFHLNASHARVYQQYLNGVFEETLLNIKAAFSYEKSTSDISQISNVHYWFQQYQKDDYHGWHMHPRCMFSSVYYLELPEDSAKTTFLISGKEVTMDVKEGDILTFPACLLHCSKPNQSSRKTVIAFNI